MPDSSETTTSGIVEASLDLDASLRFLRRWYGKRPYQLMSIDPETRKTANRTFFGTEKDNKATRWIEAQQQQSRNLYFSPNISAAKNAKAKKTDITGAVCLHVDIDPAKGQDPAEARAEAVETLNAHKPPPTVMIDSGGGVQAFWRFKTPIKFAANTLPDVSDIEARNRALGAAFGADSCWNIDRVMRLPGSVNHPDQKKRDAGRVPRRASVLSNGGQAPRYTLDDLPAGEGAPATASSSTELVALPERLPAITYEDLPMGTPPTLSNALDGDPDGDWPSRSEAVWHVVNELVRLGLDDAHIAGVLLDPEWPISESILERRDPRREAARQITRARAELSRSRAEASGTGGWEPEAVVFLDRNQAGAIRPTYENARLALAGFGFRYLHDQFKDRTAIVTPHGLATVQQYAGELTDNSVSQLRQLILDTYRFDPGKNNSADAVMQLCLEGGFNPITEYLARVQAEWDGVKRLDGWLTRYMGAPSTALNAAIGRKTLMAAARRARQPGCKFDTMLIFEGVQGTGKSTAVAILAGADEYFSDQDLLHLQGQKLQEALQGVWFYEVGDMAGLRKAEVDGLKANLSRTHDRGRPAYGRFPIDQPRRCVFIGTTNESEYLRDTSGNRRFWPVETGTVDLKALRADRDQLLGEAAAAEATGETLVLAASMWDAAAQVADTRMERDPWADVITGLVGEQITVKNDTFEFISSADLMDFHLRIEVSRLTPAHAKRAKALMLKAGWEAPRVVRQDGRPVRGFTRRIAGDAW